MWEVNIYIETSLAGPCVKDGWYSAVLECETTKGVGTKYFVGMEKRTTYYRSVLLAVIHALRRFKEYDCRITIYTRCWYVIGLYERGALESWRAEWKKPSGKDVKNKDLWQQFLNEADRFGGKEGISFAYSKSHVHKDFLTEKMQESREEYEKNRKIDPEKREEC